MATPNVTTVTYNISPQIAQNIFGGGAVNANTATFFGCGYQGDLNYKIPSNQLITIIATSFTTYGVIYGVLQKEFSLETSSDWENFIPSAGTQTDQIFQAISSLFNGGNTISLINPLTSRRMWKNTTPIKLTLEISFLSINDTNREVVVPCFLLQQLALPADGTLQVFNGNIPILTPPGPSPINQIKGDQISITIGRLFTFSPVIVKSVKIVYDNRLDINGLPISAVATVEFETYQIMTKANLATAMNYGTPSGPATIPGNNQATNPPTTLPTGGPNG